MATIMRVGGGASGSKKKLAISKLSEGDVVRIKEKGVEQDYYLAQHDYQPSLNGSGRVLFVRKDAYGTSVVWNSSNVNTYANSTMDTWLNGEMKSMYDADVREAMGETTFPYTIGNGNNTVTTLPRSVFILSASEIYGATSWSNTEGTLLPIADKIMLSYLNGSLYGQGLRTINTKEKTQCVYISTYGTPTITGVTADFVVRPCFTLPNTATVLPEANLDGSYTLSLGDDDPTKEYFKLTVVDGTEKPENPAENTIWVNTDVDMGMCYLAPNAPASPEVGDVWINTYSKDYGVRVNDNPYLEIGVGGINQYNGSAWENKGGSAIYANGGWTTMALWLFNGEINEMYPPVYMSFAASPSYGYDSSNRYVYCSQDRSGAADHVGIFFKVNTACYNTFTVYGRGYPISASSSGTLHVGLTSTEPQIGASQWHSSLSWIVKVEDASTANVWKERTITVPTNTAGWIGLIYSYSNQNTGSQAFIQYACLTIS